MAHPARQTDSRPAAAARPTTVVPFPGSRSASHDARWPAVADTLRRLRGQGRRAVRIVDVDCGAGSLLLHALRHARTLGFTAIEGRGVDGSPALVGRARAAASRTPDHAIGVAFDVADMMESVAQEAELPADILLWHASAGGDGRAMIDRLRRAGDVVIGDDATLSGVEHRA